MNWKLTNAAIGSIVTTFVLLLAMHFRPASNPTHPESLDPDLTELKLRQAPKDAEIVFLGDSITDRWRFRSELWATFGHAANLGIGGSRVANLLWLVNSGKLSAFHPKMFVVRIGVNDLAGETKFWERRKPSLALVNAGTDLIVASLKKQFPDSRVLVMPFPPPAEDIAADGIHLNDQGYQHWADALRPLISDSTRTLSKQVP